MKNTEEKRSFKEQVKELWNEYKVPVKVGVTCLFTGLAYGMVKGMQAQGQITGRAMSDLIDKIPQLPEPDDYPLDEVLKGCSKSDVMELMTQMGCDE